MKSIKYKGKVLTENDIPNYIKNRYSHRSDMLELWVHAMKRRNKWAANNKDKVKISRKKNYWSDPDRYRAETKKWWKDNPEKKKALDAEYRKNNKESIAEYMHQYQLENQEKLKINSKRYRTDPKNLDRIAERRRINNKKYAKDDRFVIRHKIQSQLSALCGKGKKYEGSRYKDIDFNKCVDALLKDALNKGYKTIQEIKITHHIDHIIPVYYYSIDEFPLAYNPLNLRWLLASENCSRGNKIRPEDLEIIKTLPKEIYPEGFKYYLINKKEN